VVEDGGLGQSEPIGDRPQRGALVALRGEEVEGGPLLPRWSVALAWSALLVCVLFGQLGTLLEVPQPVLNISPFTHLPAVPADDPAVTPTVVLSLVAVALAGAGLVLFRRRDLAVGG